MKTFTVKKTTRTADAIPIETKVIGTVTASSHTEAMRKAANQFNGGNWADISVEPKTK